ncbi:Uncharacterised protein [marine metagenome]
MFHATYDDHAVERLVRLPAHQQTYAHDNPVEMRFEPNLKSKQVFEEIGCVLAYLWPVLVLPQYADRTKIW